MPRLSHADLARLCSRAYAERVGVSSELEFLIHRQDEITYIAIRGTEASTALDGFNWLDVIRDMRVLPRHNQSIGWGHGGFVCGGESVARSLMEYADLTGSIVITGHSLGAAVGLIASAILHDAGVQVIEAVLFGCPRTCALIRPKIVFPVTSYRHGSDIVTNVPRWYRQPVQLTPIKPNNKIPNWADHSIDAYESALRAMSQDI